MGCLVFTIPFEANLPTATALAAALCQHTGEIVTYENGQLVCTATGDAFGANPSEDEPAHWELRTTNLAGGYLWHASLVVLQTLGGSYPHKLPLWAYKPWQETKQEYEQDNAAELILDEARRLGVE